MSSTVDLDSVYRIREEYPSPCDYTLSPTQIQDWTKSIRNTNYSPDQTLLHTLTIDVLSLPYPRVELFADTIVYSESITSAGVITATNHSLSDDDVVEVLDSVAPFVRGQQYIVKYVSPNSFSVSLNTSAGTYVGTAVDQAFTSVRNQLRFALVTAGVQLKLEDAMMLLKMPRLYLNVEPITATYRNQDTMSSINGVHRNDKFSMIQDTIQYDDNGQGLWIHYRSLIPQITRYTLGQPIHIRISDRGGKTISYFDDDKNSTSFPDVQKQTLLTFNVTPFVMDNNYVPDAIVSKAMHL
jgi:hypothetical protein